MSSNSRPADGGERLLVAAVAEIAAARNGPGEVSLRAIARRAGLSHNAAQHHFGDRAGLFTAVAAYGFDRLASELQEAVDRAGSAAGQALRASGRAYLDFGLAEPNLLDLMFRSDLVRADDPALRASQQRAFGALEQSVPGDDPIRSDDPLVAWAFIHGLVSLARHGALPTDPGPDSGSDPDPGRDPNPDPGQSAVVQRVATAFADLLAPDRSTRPDGEARVSPPEAARRD